MEEPVLVMRLNISRVC